MLLDLARKQCESSHAMLYHPTAFDGAAIQAISLTRRSVLLVLIGQWLLTQLS
jgi:hypothetical protein